MPADNPVKGTHVFRMGDADYTLRFSWNGLSQVHAKYPDGHNVMNPDHLAEIMAIGLAEHHPDITPEAVKEISPPVMAAVEAVTRALNYAYFGSAEPPKKDGDASPSRKTARKALSSAPSEQQPELASTPNGSGD